MSAKKAQKDAKANKNCPITCKKCNALWRREKKYCQTIAGQKIFYVL